MKRIASILLIGVAIILASSCIDDTTIVDNIEKTPNLIGFTDATASFSGIADGTEYSNDVKLRVFGPTMEALSGTYSATIAVDEENSTAIEGTHFSLPSNAIEINVDGENFRTTFPVVLLTEGIVTPLEEAPVLVLKVTDVSGAGEIIASGAKLTISLLYLCPSDLAGDYDVTIVRDDGAVYEYSETIAEIGVGKYRGESVGRWEPGSIGGEPGFDFIDVCGQITVPKQLLLNYYSNEVYQGGDSHADQTAGTIHIEYYITFGAGPQKFVADYVRK